MSDPKPEYALLVSAVAPYGIVEITAHIVRVEDDGSFINPGNHWPYTDQGYADLCVTQFADNGKPTCARAEYRTVHSADLDRAERMVKTLRTLTRGLDRIRKAEGYHDDSDYPAFLFRVARVLKIKRFYVRNTREGYRNSGQHWRTADAGSVQAWYAHALDNIGQGNVLTYDH